MDGRDEFRDFLTSRRARITPDQAGLPAYGGSNRRVPGLRREEVALLAGVSVEYYTRLERGNARGVSESVLDNLARALQLDEAERAHLFDLARAASSSGSRTRRPAKQQVRPIVQRILDGMEGVPAHVRNGRFESLAVNRLGRALLAPVYEGRELPVSHARFAFLDPRAHEFYGDWERTANDIVAALRSEAGRNPYDKALTDLIGELSTRSEFFRTRWAAHNVRFHNTGVKVFHHPVVGELRMEYESLELTDGSGLAMSVYSPEPGSPSEDAMALLASWAATMDREQEDARQADARQADTRQG
ncbi:helix-turn-helix transcriptional regulator [Catenulispora pinisilvae]|uniref:helix-turn-helix transcriptional regulator n=1 Tax=Catenulispora pinisilvae TaxID=2705253 RepID=UPI0018922042|nr:helix-turn-helix transcriptional regulator [Catenulispora pinisilvae]